MTEQHCQPSSSRRPRLIVVGGGFSAASLVVQLLRCARLSVEIVIVESRANVGCGLAYSATDSDYRLNAPLDVHWIDPNRPLELRHWFEERGILEADPACMTSNGLVFLRRSDLGKYLTDTIDGASRAAPAGSSIRHVRDTATSVALDRGVYQVQCAKGGIIDGEMLVIATGNPVPALRTPFSPAHEVNPRIIGNPLEPGCLDHIPKSARVLVVGSGLTALDIASTFVRRQHMGGILVVSRRGYRPSSQSPESLRLPPKPVELGTAIPPFIEGEPATIAAWTRALRKQIRRDVAEGKTWFAAFDSVRDVVWKLWPRLSTREKLKFLNRLRVFYDVHRFRTPPMNEELVATAERGGDVRYAAAALLGVEASPSHVNVLLSEGSGGQSKWHQFDFVVNCTGLDAGSAWRRNALLRSLLEQGLLRLHPTGIGFDVSEQCEAFDSRGVPQPTLRVIGPPTAGAFGDPVAIPFIANQVQRILPDLLRTLDSLHHFNDETYEPTSID
ncbi:MULTISPECIES: FAD/NAD(P)-binding protein [unclassified Variovorax]|uniref:FAD/NAD(P)-binding protein n=1 Tax=unclassified Variovorax TaxID=663243 RepID=UPI00076D3D0F|nr:MULTISPECIES: FAD/NAD(P)-binding protein [unclassified Variovorax]KWT69567.1 FAD dependent oxidoreductase [Variovorax sp. WDL1]PNG48886.1 hypothetical protein CHC06_06654 [Variovorax sp. B2]PNG49393.1 hypothetical protein CHC07_06302 [Variovorax sp. B4]VTV18304.1 hypothetical protein WDL1P2_00022 [Variovorax sp. WDL1]